MSICKKILLAFLILIFCTSAVLLIIFSGSGSLFSWGNNRERAAKDWQERELFFANILDEMIDEDIWEIDEMTTADMVVLDKYLSLVEQNQDMVGWLNIEGTIIDYPVLQSKDNPDYYLDHGFDGNYLYEGSLFMDSKSDLDESANYLIYGHNMKNGAKFGQLSKYKDESYYQNHSNIRFETIYQETNYEIIAVFLSQIYYASNTVFKYYKWGLIANEADFDNYVKNIKQLSLYDTGQTAAWGDQLLTLSTCYYHTDNGRFVVVAKKIID